MKLRGTIEVCTEIQIKRVEMIKLAQIYGINGEETVHASQELDLLINEYFIIKHRSDINVKEDMNNREFIEK
jgi:hypothetical protein